LGRSDSVRRRGKWGREVDAGNEEGVKREEKRRDG